MIVCVSSKNHRIGMLFLQKLSRRLFFLKSVQNTLLLKVLLLRHHLQYKIGLPHHWNVFVFINYHIKQSVLLFKS
jgi:hypothetical protein